MKAIYHSRSEQNLLLALFLEVELHSLLQKQPQDKSATERIVEIRRHLANLPIDGSILSTDIDPY